MDRHRVLIVNKILQIYNKESMIDDEDCIIIDRLMRRYDLVCASKKMITDFDAEFNGKKNSSNIYS